MVRITTEIVENAPQFTNAIKDREIDLHGYKFQAIENLGATLDQFDTIDLSGNEFRKLDGFPLLKRVKCLILSNNKIMRVAEDLAQNVPNINTLILTSNNFTDLRELDPLAYLQKLTFLSLLHCPVTMRSNYRPYVISLLPSLRFLDYKRVTQNDRKIAHTLFKRPSAPSTKNASNVNSGALGGSNLRTTGALNAGGVKTFVPGAPLQQQTVPAAVNGAEAEPVEDTARATVETGVPPTPAAAATVPGGKRPGGRGGSTQDLYAIQEAIKRARTMDEVDRLHHLLSSGQFAGFAVQWQQHLRRQQQEKQQQQQVDTQPSAPSPSDAEMPPGEPKSTEEAPAIALAVEEPGRDLPGCQSDEDLSGDGTSGSDVSKVTPVVSE